MKTEKKQSKKEQKESVAGAEHVSQQTISTRGRIFEGKVTKKFPTRVVVESERTVYVKKYERFYKKKSRIHARLPQGMDVHIGDLVHIQECRPLSKIIHAIVVKKIKSAQALTHSTEAEKKQ
ncbi:MAG: 30S ribosomal protein S17 [Nanoarchaeota archaeon]